MAELNMNYVVARIMILRPFAAPPPAPDGEIISAKDKSWRMEAAEIARLLRVLPHLVDSLWGSEVTNGAVSLTR